MSKLKKDDQVIVLAGADKGVVGTIVRFMKDRVVVQGVNVRKKHVKASQDNPKGSIVEMEKPVHISNVALCVDGKPQKLKSKTVDGQKGLYYTLEGKEVLHRTLKKK